MTMRVRACGSGIRPRVRGPATLGWLAIAAAIAQAQPAPATPGGPAVTSPAAAAAPASSPAAAASAARGAASAPRPGTAAPAAAAAPAPAECLPAEDITNLQIVGRWDAEFPEDQRTLTLVLELHPQFADSFAGTLQRPNGERARVVGDIESGDFTMEESPDGVRIAATWLGDVVAGSCGREIRGQWQAATGRTTPFILRKP